jgi:hypothetical protein
VAGGRTLRRRGTVCAQRAKLAACTRLREGSCTMSSEQTAGPLTLQLAGGQSVHLQAKARQRLGVRQRQWRVHAWRSCVRQGLTLSSRGPPNNLADGDVASMPKESGAGPTAGFIAGRFRYTVYRPSRKRRHSPFSPPVPQFHQSAFQVPPQRCRGDLSACMQPQADLASDLVLSHTHAPPRPVTVRAAISARCRNS